MRVSGAQAENDLEGGDFIVAMSHLVQLGMSGLSVHQDTLILLLELEEVCYKNTDKLSSVHFI